MVPYWKGICQLPVYNSLILNLLKPRLNLILSEDSLRGHPSLQAEVVSTFLTFSPISDRDGTIIIEPAFEIRGPCFLNCSAEKGLAAEASHSPVMPQKGLVGLELAYRTGVLPWSLFLERTLWLSIAHFLWKIIGKNRSISICYDVSNVTDRKYNF